MNQIEYGAVFQRALDKTMIADLCTGWMDQNADRAKYEGGAQIKIPKLMLSGLGDYNRLTGYPEGTVTLEFETRMMTQDRGRGFCLDAMDVEESGFVLAAGEVLGEFQKKHVVPEVDAYRISQLSALSSGRNRTYTPEAKNLLKALRQDIAAVQDKIGEREALVVMMSLPVASLMDENDSISRQLNVGDFSKGEASMKVKMIDEVPILRVPSGRMHTDFTFFDGVSAADGIMPDQTAGGFAQTPTAGKINWIVCARTAPIAVCKTDTVRIFDPASYQKAHAWRLDYRKYHDMWVSDNQLDGIFVNRA